MVLEKTLESPLDYKEIQWVHSKGNQSWIFIGRTDAEVETPILWPPDAKNWLTEKDTDAGKYWRQEEKGMTEDEMVGWPHRLDAHKFEQTPGFGHGQKSLACCSPRGLKESDRTEQLNWRSSKFGTLWTIKSETVVSFARVPQPFMASLEPWRRNSSFDFLKLLEYFPRRLWLRSISHMCSKTDLGKFGSPNSLKRPFPWLSLPCQDSL